MLNSKSRANSNGSLLVFSVGGHRKTRDHRGILTGYGLTQVGLESPSCIEDGCPCTKVSHQEIPVQESQSPNANRISGAESDQGWLSLQMEQSSLSAEESRLEVRHPSQDVWCTTVTRSVQNKDVSHHFPAAWCKNKTTQPLSKRRDNSGEFHLEERKQTAGRDQRRSVELVTNDGTDHEIFMLDTSDYPWCKIN